MAHPSPLPELHVPLPRYARAWYPRFAGDLLVDHRVKFSTLLVLAAVGCRLAHGEPEGAWTSTPVPVAGLVMLVLGLALRSWAAGVLDKGHNLATRGPYALCRHPLYLGTILMMAGSCLWLREVLGAGILGLGSTALYLVTIHREEVRLEIRLGQAWHEYARRTPALVPGFRLSRLSTRWRFHLWRKNREYRASGAGLAVIVLVVGWTILAR